MRHHRHPLTVAAVLAALLSLLVVLPQTAAAADPRPVVTVSPKEIGAGGTATVTGRGWQPNTVLTLLLCGQNAIGGTNACANATGRVATTDEQGAFTRELPVAAPPKPCPCVVHVSTVMGETVTVDAPFVVAGHPVAPLPAQTTGGRLVVLSTRLEGSSGLLNWFGAPPDRRLVVTLGNFGSGPAKDPVLQVGTSHGVFAPAWEEQTWHGSIQPGAKVRFSLPVELASGAYGDYTVSLRYGGKTETEPWHVPRPWGVTLFWLLLCVVVPTAVFRIGMAVIDRWRPNGRPRPTNDGPHPPGRPRWRDRLRLPGRPRPPERPHPPWTPPPPSGVAAPPRPDEDPPTLTLPAASELPRPTKGNP